VLNAPPLDPPRGSASMTQFADPSAALRNRALARGMIALVRRQGKHPGTGAGAPVGKEES
jgi:hypothetical protein